MYHTIYDIHIGVEKELKSIVPSAKIIGNIDIL